MTLFRELRSSSAEERSGSADWLELLSFAGNTYGVDLVGTMPGSKSEAAPNSLVGYARQVYARSGVVAACMFARHFLFVEAGAVWRNLADRSVFTDRSLEPIQRPWPGGTLGELLGRMEQDATLAGNAYLVRSGRGVRRLRPDWVSIIIGTDGQDPDDPDADVVGYLYRPGGQQSNREVVYLPEEVAHYAPYPDPLARYRGQSWLTPILSDISTDVQMVDHKSKFFEQGATTNLAITYPAMDPEKFQALVRAFDDAHTGARNAHRVLHLAGGADPKQIGSSLKDMDYKAVQGAGESRICAAARVPAAIAGISEGMQGSSLNSGNYTSQRRQFADQFAHPCWKIAFASLENLLDRPAMAQLWYDVSDCAYLRDDQKDRAEALNRDAGTIKALVEAGYDPVTVPAAVAAGDFTLLTHTGNVSVQLQPPGSGD